jgi:hypothetical protein
MDNTNMQTKKQFKFAKMRFTEMKTKNNKKNNETSEKQEDSDINEAEKIKRELNEKDLKIIEGELDNQELLLKVIDNINVSEHVDEFFSRELRLKEEREGKDNAQQNDEPLKVEETLDEFWKKYKNFNDTVRKGNIKNMTPCYGFIKSSQDNFLIPNPIGLFNKHGESDSIYLR